MLCQILRNRSEIFISLRTKVVSSVYHHTQVIQDFPYCTTLNTTPSLCRSSATAEPFSCQWPTLVAKDKYYFHTGTQVSLKLKINLRYSHQNDPYRPYSFTSNKAVTRRLHKQKLRRFTSIVYHPGKGQMFGGQINLRPPWQSYYSKYLRSTGIQAELNPHILSISTHETADQPIWRLGHP